MEFKPFWGKEEKPQIKAFNKLRRTCKLCGKGLSLFDGNRQFHKKCKKQHKKNYYQESKAKLGLDKL